jgi:hypothetical protein
MPSDPSLPVHHDLLRPLANIIRRVHHEENTWRVRSGSQSVDGGEPNFPKTVGAMLNLSMVTTLPAGLVMRRDHASSSPRQSLYLGEQDAFASLG